MKKTAKYASLLIVLCALALACNLPSVVNNQGENGSEDGSDAPASTPAGQPASTLRPTFTATAGNTLVPTPLSVTWNQVGLPTGAQDMNNLLVHPADENLWFASGHPGEDNMVTSLYRSRDAGSTWQKIYTGGIMWVLYLDPNNPDNLYASDDGKLIKSTDLGDSWSTLHDFVDVIESVLVSTVDSAIFVAPRLYGDEHPGIYRSMDNGQTWQRFPYGVEMINFIPWDIEEDPNTGTLYVVIEIGHHPQPYDPPFYRSTDRGETWEDVGAELPWHGICIRVDPLTSDVYFLTEGSGLYKSTDQGLHWHRISPEENFASHLTLDPASPPRFFGGDLVHEPAYTGGIYFSRDGGESFIFIGLDGYIITDITLNAASTRLYIASYREGIFTAEIPPP
jgi:photosystem II stability/assembly factor-like uncharacterized protein